MNFKYKARDADGNIVSGMGEAPNKDALLRDLRARGFSPIAVVQAKPAETLGVGAHGSRPPKAKRSVLNLAWGKTVKDEEVFLFTRDLFSLVHSGVNLVSGIRDIAAEIENVHFRFVLEALSEDINAGSKLSEAMSRHPKIFNQFYINNIRAGEQAGRLEEVLERITQSLDHEIETKIMVRNAVRYPAIVLGFLVLAFILITTIIVPRIAGVFAKFGTELPLPTRILIAVGDFMEAYGFFILAGITVLTIAVWFYRRTRQGRWVWDSVMLGFPVFGSLVRKIGLSRFASTLQTLYASGIVLPDALESSASVVGNEVLAHSIRAAGQGVSAGRPLSETLRENRIFPSVVTRMVMTGEKTGSLENMLGEIRSHYDREIHYQTKKLGTLIEPILTVLLGLMVLVLALGVFLPMWNVIKLFKS